jgi:hypothetical protein
MSTPGKLIVQSLKLFRKFHRSSHNPTEVQRRTLKALLLKSANTAFGKQYEFKKILKATDLVRDFQENVPLHSYSEMRERWWERCLNGGENVTWPGKVKYFALSSGTSDASSKHIPVTQEMIKSTRKVGFAQLYSLADFNIPPVTFQKSVLMLGGTTSLNAVNGYYEGDMSGISTLKMPGWISKIYFRPGQKIASEPSWQERIRQIVTHAHRWDIGMVCGIPSWMQIVFEKIIEHYRLQNIHEIWPNLNVYIHGGVSFDHYRECFEKLLGKPVTYIETYMASEGSFGFKSRPGAHGMRLITDAGIFFEFIEFNAQNFDADGNLRPGAQVLTAEQVNESAGYAIVLSTCAGAWRYLIGDVVQFTDRQEMEIAIIGRTSQFLNLCGEHVSIGNINQAISMTAASLNISIGEFSVAGIRYENLFAYRWYIGCDDPAADVDSIKNCLDQALSLINDDYRVEREAGAIKEVSAEIFPNAVFHGYLKWMNKDNPMSKFPRVLKNGSLLSWNQYLNHLHPEPGHLNKEINAFPKG